MTPAAANVDESLVAHYALDETSGTVAADSSGNDLHGTFEGNPQLEGDHGVRLDGSNDFIKLPDNILADLDEITVSVQALIRPEQSGNYFIWGLGNPATSGSGNGYLFASGNADYRTRITLTNWSGEQNVSSGSALPRGTWHTLTYTLAGGTAILYLDGVEVSRNDDITITPAQIGGGVTTSNHIGKSNYAADGLLSGSVRDFRIYSEALRAEDVASLVPTAAESLARDIDILDLGDTSAVTEDLSLPLTAPNGSEVTWESSNSAVLSDDGNVTRPAADEDDITVTLTATLTNAGETETKAFEVTVLAEAGDEAIVQEAADALTIVNAEDVRGNVTIPDGPSSVEVTWESSDPAIVSTDGIVNRPDADTTVTLTATVVRGEAEVVREIELHVRAAIELDEFEAYAFSYFTGNSLAGENIFLSRSDGNDALNWHELNNGQPILTSDYGTGGLRDPFIIRSPEGDTFYLIATDLSIGSGTSWGDAVRHGSQYLEIWESHDLVNWSEQRHVKVSPDNAGNTWAPEAYYDDSIGAYVVFWASSLYDTPDHSDNSYHRMMFSTTRDFVNFTEAEVWQDTPGYPRIDTTVLKVDEYYHRFTKDEGSGATGCTDLMHERSMNLRGQMDEWEPLATCIGRDAGTSALEGPSIFKSNPNDVNGEKFYLFVDEYGGRGFLPLETDDINDPNWQISATYNLPSSPRHGTVFPITQAEWDALEAYVDPGPDPLEPNTDGEILRYTFEDGVGTTVTDVSGAGRHGTIVGDVNWNDDSLVFNGSNTYVDLPDNLLAGLTDITVEADVYIASEQSNPYFIYGLGNRTGSAGDGYLFTTGNTYRSSITTGNWTGEQTASSNQALPRGQWVHLVYTLEDGVATIYLDGVPVGTNENVTITPGDIGGGYTSWNALGRSLYTGDNLFNGQMREFAIYNRALSASEVLELSGNWSVLTNVSLAEDVLRLDPIVSTADRTVRFLVERDTDLSALTPQFETLPGVTVDPSSGTTVDLSESVDYTVTSESGETEVWNLSAVVMGSPVLEGLYADPNIITVGGTYYIYATSDGYPGWGGKEFYAWKSFDLVNWERADEPFLVLDGENGNVPWASGNAWAPTIIERDGKFYFYFSGHNDQYNRKTIGVAVADHPEGPFVAEPEAMILNNEEVTTGQAIDPAAFHDPVTDKWYLYWGNGHPPVMAELADDMISLVPGTIQAMEGLQGYREGTFVNYREGTYHVTYSIDDTGSEDYRVGYATGPTAEGPWTYQGVILEKRPELGILGTGHNSVLNVPGTDDWYIVYHRFAIPDGNGNNRETTIDRIPITEDGLFGTVTPTLESVPAQFIEDPDPLTVTLDGEARVGETLSAIVPEAWDITSIQWSRDGEPVNDVEGIEYVLAEADLGATITVEVTGYKEFWPTGVAIGSSDLVTDGSEEPGEVDREALAAAIAAAEALDASDYTEESWADLAEALAAARAVLADEDATQDEVDAALAALNDAIANLDEVDDGDGPGSDPGDSDGTDGDQGTGGDSDGGLSTTGAQINAVIVAILMLMLLGLGALAMRRRLT